MKRDEHSCLDFGINCFQISIKRNCFDIAKGIHPHTGTSNRKQRATTKDKVFIENLNTRFEQSNSR